MLVKEWYLSHGREGFIVKLDARKLSHIVKEAAYDWLMEKLGHPCCKLQGRFSYRIGWLFLQYPNKWMRGETLYQFDADKELATKFGALEWEFIQDPEFYCQGCWAMPEYCKCGDKL